MGLYPGDKLPTLCQAAKNDNYEMVKKLLTLHFNPNEKDPKGSTPLMHAVYYFILFRVGMEIMKL